MLQNLRADLKRRKTAGAPRWGGLARADMAIGPARFAVRDIPNQMLRDIYRYWLGKAGPEDPPARADVDPLDLAKFLPQVFLVEVGPDGRFLYRVVGTRIAEWSNGDATGRYLEDVTVLYDIEGIRRDFQSVVDARAPRFDLRDAPWFDREFMRYHRLLLPLAEPGGRVTYLFGGVDINYARE